MSLGYTNFREIEPYINGLSRTSHSGSGDSDQDVCSPVIRNAEWREKPVFGSTSDYNQWGYAVKNEAMNDQHITYNASVPSPLAEFWYSSEHGKDNVQLFNKGYIVDHQRRFHPGFAYDRPQKVQEFPTNVGMDDAKRPIKVPSPLSSTNWHKSCSKLLAGQEREMESSGDDLDEQKKEDSRDQQMLKGCLVDHRSIHPGLAYDRPQNVGMDDAKTPEVNIPSPIMSTNWHYSSSKLAGQERETESSSAVDLEERHKEGNMINSSSEDDLEEDTQNEDSSREEDTQNEDSSREGMVMEVLNVYTTSEFLAYPHPKAKASAKYNNLKPLTVAQPPSNNEVVHGTKQLDTCGYEYPKARASAKYYPKGQTVAQSVPYVYEYPLAKYDPKPNAQAAVARPPLQKKKKAAVKGSKEDSSCEIM